MLPDPYACCSLCGRRCLSARSAGEAGFCGETSSVRVAWAGLHMGEEPPLVGDRGSGTVFFTGCALACAFCQNRQISQEGMGRAVSVGELADIFLALQGAGAANVNLVTAGHHAPAVAEALALARGRGLGIPALWNSSGYESPGSLEPLRGLVDVWLPDLKTLDARTAAALFRAPDYPERARESLLWMAALAPPSFDGDALVRGLMVRHLVLPGRLDLTRDALRWYAENLEGRALLSVMTQYTPIEDMPSRKELPPAAAEAAAKADGSASDAQGDARSDALRASLDGGRYLAEGEREAVVAMLEEFGIEEGFCQELLPGSDWLPDFERENPFSAALSRTVWHWKKGFIS